jgi:mannose-6-phosphate isomerase-like protein (cupin superfamily)
MRSAVFPLAKAQRDVKIVDGKRRASVAERGTLRLLLSLPLHPNSQAPHEQDELYVVVRGSGVLFHEGRRDAFATGDAMFIAAGVEHHFEDFTGDLVIWVIFYGPEDGEHTALIGGVHPPVGKALATRRP